MAVQGAQVHVKIVVLNLHHRAYLFVVRAMTNGVKEAENAVLQIILGSLTKKVIESVPPSR